MRNESAHLSDEELLLLADREATPGRAAKARDHLDQCQPCRARMATLEKTLAAFVLIHEENVSSHTSSMNHRSAFKTKLSQQVANSAGGRRVFWQSMVFRQFASACIAILIVAGGAWVVRGLVQDRLTLRGAEQLANALPRKRLTPGATRPVRLDELCHVDDNDDLSASNRAPNLLLEQQVFTEYGLPAAAHNSYELDYLITPQLGGSADIHNLWPEPYSSTSWNAHVKDQLEDHLHELVCHGNLPLSTAQDEIASDWIAAYKRYFHTETPLSNAATFTPTVPVRAATEFKAPTIVETPAS